MSPKGGGGGAYNLHENFEDLVEDGCIWEGADCPLPVECLQPKLERFENTLLEISLMLPLLRKRPGVGWPRFKESTAMRYIYRCHSHNPKTLESEIQTKVH